MTVKTVISELCWETDIFSDFITGPGTL